MRDLLFFVALPYASIALFFAVSIIRYRNDPFSYSSLSSQFLESKKLFWGSVPFHIGILTVLTGHLIGLLIPRQVMLFNQVPARLFILEVTGMVAAFLCLVGLIGLVYRRAINSRLRANTSTADLVVYALLFFQIITGLWVAITLRWGSAWYVHTAVPYLWSIFTFDPQIEMVSELKLAAQLHIIGAWVLVGAFSFTRLVHVLVAPIPYLWRPFQQVIWYRERK